jgi:hypothetical protein
MSLAIDSWKHIGEGGGDLISKKVKKFTRRGYRSSSRLALVFSYYVVFFCSLFSSLFRSSSSSSSCSSYHSPSAEQLSAAIHKSPPPAPSWPTSPTSSQLVKGSRPTQECSVNVLLTRRGRNHFFEIFISSSTCVCVSCLIDIAQIVDIFHSFDSNKFIHPKSVIAPCFNSVPRVCEFWWLRVYFFFRLTVNKIWCFFFI